MEWIREVNSNLAAKIRQRDGVTVIEGKPNKARLIVHPRITRGKDEKLTSQNLYALIYAD